jgi:ribosomal-protein-alanine N-acetyltransferase
MLDLNFTPFPVLSTERLELRKITTADAEAIFYVLHPLFQGRGLMQEAMIIVIDYGFRAMHLHSIEANVNPDNAASIKLLERNNFVREAYHKENSYFNGKIFGFCNLFTSYPA